MAGGNARDQMCGAGRRGGISVFRARGSVAHLWKGGFPGVWLLTVSGSSACRFREQGVGEPELVLPGMG